MAPDGPLYPGTCRLHPVEPGPDVAWRLDMARALEWVGALEWEDERRGLQQADPAPFGDVVLWRKDAPASYHLAATVDDAADGVSVVTRGMDLFRATHVHRLLQALLGLPVPRWHHHGVLVGPDGRKLAKRRDAPDWPNGAWRARTDRPWPPPALWCFDTGICLADAIDLAP
jgi:glutamyl-Q tRNA(Asp) synthetase